MKICSKCSIKKELGEFSKDKYKIDGLLSYCKECTHNYYINNKDIFLKLRKKHTENGNIKLTGERYYNKYKEVVKEKSRNYCKKKYYSDELYRYTIKLRSMVRRIFKQANIIKTERSSKLLGYTNIQLYTHLSKYYSNSCIDKRACIGTILNSFNSHIDHIIPLSKGKTVEEKIRLCELNNLRLICDKCNLTKHNKGA
jgi:hypothetical protein